jgi:hypothetical protein
MDLLGKGGGGGGQPNALAPQQQTGGQPNYASGNYGAAPIGQPGSQSGPDYSSYVSSSPGLQGAFQGLRPQDIKYIKNQGYDANGDGQIDQGEYGNFHYTTMGKNEGRKLPQYTNALAQTNQPVGQPQTNQPVGQPQTANVNGPQTQAPAGEPALQTGPTEGPTEGPMTQALRQTPGYQFMQDEGRRAIENSFASRGKLLSGSAMTALQDRSMGVADQSYQQSVNNNFNLANLGMGAAARMQIAGNSYANGASNALMNAGNAQANGYMNQANAWNQGAQGVGNALMGGVGMYGGYKGWGGAGGATNAAPSTGTYNGVF